MSDAISDRRQRPVDVWRMRKKFMDLLTTPGILGFPPSIYTEHAPTEALVSHHIILSIVFSYLGTKPMIRPVGYMVNEEKSLDVPTTPGISGFPPSIYTERKKTV